MFDTIMFGVVSFFIAVTFIIGMARIAYPQDTFNMELEKLNQFTGSLLIGFSLISAVLLISL